MSSIRVLVTTWAKVFTRPAVDLPSSQKALLEPGTYEVNSVTRGFQGHALVSFKEALFSLDRQSSLHNWYVFEGHFEAVPALDLLGFINTRHNELIPGTRNFRCGEITRNGTRPLPSLAHAQRAQQAAMALQAIRDTYNRPCHVISWYRDPATNRAVGGASKSRHMEGDGVDFFIDGIGVSATYATADRVIGNRGGVGWYPTSGHTHIDLRGYRERW